MGGTQRWPQLFLGTQKYHLSKDPRIKAAWCVADGTSDVGCKHMLFKVLYQQ